MSLTYNKILYQVSLSWNIEHKAENNYTYRKTLTLSMWMQRFMTA
jgi:hypothetical protein